MDFITEHLAEVAMNNGLATLPLWQRSWKDPGLWQGFLSAGYSSIGAQEMNVDGYMLGLALERTLSPTWAIRGLLFADDSTVSGTPGVRELTPIFLKPLPSGMPALAQFGELDGSLRNTGAGITATWRNQSGWMDGSEWIFGAVWQRLSLEQYATTYTLVSGPASGSSGAIDFTADYDYVTLLAGMQWHRRYASWLFAPHWHASIPLPRGAVAGRLTGPGFDRSGDSETADHGRHIGDAYLSLGLSITYLPAHLTFDVGTLLSQSLLEPLVDEGISSDLVLSAEWSF
jgi:hypothetical protein